jgi:large subunit ribosomal protein L3
MPNKRAPRHGSMQYWPRKRAKRIIHRRRAWPSAKEAKPLGFYGYKVQMLHGMATDSNPKSPSKGEEIAIPMTLLECPPLKLFSVRLYKKTDSGLKVAKEVLISNDKLLSSKLPLPKELKGSIDSIKPEECDEIRLLVYTDSKSTSRGQKQPEVFELGLGGNPAEQLEYAKAHINNGIRMSDVFSEGEQVDIGGITKGKGFQGVVKRYGVSLKAKKSEKKKRSVGNLGAWSPTRVLISVPQPGKMGFHARIDRNKQILKISDEQINPKGGFKHYGLVKNEYVLIKGSVPGPAKRMLRLYKARHPARNVPKEAPALEHLVVRK